MNKSKTDFTIHIRNVQPEDTGTYYCVKFVKSYTGVDEVFAAWQWHRGVRAGTVMVTLQEDDVRSQLICEVQHPTLLVPLQGRYQLSRVLRGANLPSSLLLLLLCILLEKGFLGGILFFLFRRMRRKASEMFPCPAPSQFLDPRVRSQGVATASSDIVGAQLGQGFSLQQPQTKVSVAAGETLTLNCTTSGIASPGPVKWLKGWDRGFQTIYDQKTYRLSHVMRAVAGSNTDFTIHIRNVQPEDTGTYYCVKFVKSYTGVDEVFLHGNGTEVSMQGEWGSGTEVSVQGEWGSGTEVSVLGEWGSGTEVSVLGEWGSGTEVSMLGEWGSGTEVSVQGEWGNGTEVSVLGEWGSGTEVSVQGEWGSGTEVSVLGEWGSGTEVSVQGEWGSGTEVSVQGEWGSGTEVSVHIEWGSGTEVSVLGEWGSGTEVSVQGEWGSGTEVSVLGEWGSGTEVSVQGEWGSGTEVSVQAKPSPPLVSGPEQRAEPGQSVPFTCTTGGFFPKEIGVKWFKNKDPMVAQPPQVTESRVKTYNISSTVMVTLQEDDVRSQLICEVQHPTLLVPLQGRYPLSRVLRVPPSVEVRAEPSPVEVNKTVTFTCLVKKFYPANVSVSWLENGSEIKVENISRPVELHWGLFELRSQVEVQATEEKNGSTISCVVVHDGRAPASYSTFLWTSNPGQGGLSKGFQMYEGANLPSSLLLLLLCILLEKGFFGGILFFLFRRMRRKASEMFPCPALS
ncbi:hypothetical protein DUI87_27877 [Hirundo rustica rustica]|uniref:Ig-like domain-containing protein n=1 Tax=Hirundo rustica rustica TaxID=333673 RepID=A0A3M0J4D2_HIRRU|nr:hypothetical protein DUI87_27877 [Hirundo rustica rustica]